MNFWKYFLAALSTVVCLQISGIPSAHADELENLINRQMVAATDTQSSNRSDADQLISSAMGLLGVAYRYGGTSASTGFDCSGFMQHIFRRSMQINLPRTSAEQARMGVAVSRSDLQPGDMVFFSTVGGRISHVGLYIGNNRFIHAPRTGKSIEITSMSNKYWNARYVTARRVKKNDPSRFLQ
ncbi:C40 family peptidase [Neisseria sp. S1]|uniref:C40 family peptidase n=1 Tax=Neisseria sp. S1 TaxID=3318354 RepID=UPI003A8A37DB